MIKFFRNIRKKLFNKGKITAYLKYAIGEVVLVVLGILIAIQVNNWNEVRKNRIEEETYITGISQDLNEQITQLDVQLKNEEAINKLATDIIVFFNKNDKFVVNDSLLHKMARVSGRLTFVTRNTTYVEMESSGQLSLISDLKLKNHIVSFYHRLAAVEKVIEKNNDIVDLVFLPVISKNTLLKSSAIGHFLEAYQSNAPKKYVDIESTPQFKENIQIYLNNKENEVELINHINFRRFLTQIHLEYLKGLKQEAIAVLKDIENE